MLGVLAAFDFLKSREKAIIIWAVILVGFVAYKSDGLGSSLGAVLRSFFVTKLVFLFGAAAAYCAALVLAANELGLWHTTAIKVTTYWFFGAGVVLAGSAVTGRDDPARRGRPRRRRRQPRNHHRHRRPAAGESPAPPADQRPPRQRQIGNPPDLPHRHAGGLRTDKFSGR